MTAPRRKPKKLTVEGRPIPSSHELAVFEDGVIQLGVVLNFRGSDFLTALTMVVAHAAYHAGVPEGSVSEAVAVAYRDHAHAHQSRPTKGQRAAKTGHA